MLRGLGPLTAATAMPATAQPSPAPSARPSPPGVRTSSAAPLTPRVPSQSWTSSGPRSVSLMPRAAQAVSAVTRCARSWL